MIEVEIKVRITDPDIIRKKLEENQAIYKLSLLHEDTYCNMPIGLRDFKKTDEALRVRKSVRFDKNYKDSMQKIENYLTYKGKKIDLVSKTREEIDIGIENLEEMIKILKILGFQEVLTVCKERELYEVEFKNEKIEILLDYIPVLNQHFIEVEYLTEADNEIEKARNLLFDFLRIFGIQKSESIKKSYLELILEKEEMDK
jgi:adenylate cyclase class 2